MKVRSSYLLLMFSVAQILWLWLATGCDACCPTLEGPTCNCFKNGSRGSVCDMGGPYTKHYDSMGCPYYSGAGCCNCPDGGTECYCTESCSSSGWCMKCPLGDYCYEELKDVWGVPSEGSVYLLSRNGMVLRWDGTEWIDLENPERVAEGIWCSESGEVFVVGMGYDVNQSGRRGRAWKYDGEQWTQVGENMIGSLLAVWGTGADNVYFVGVKGTVLQYDGETYTRLDSLPQEVDFTDIWGSSADDVYLVGYGDSGGEVYHFDGLEWSRIKSTDTGLLAVSGCEQDVYIIARLNIVHHYDGSDWHEHNVFFSGYHDELYGVWCNSRTDVFTVGSAVYHYDGSDWSRVETGFGESYYYLEGIWADPAGSIYIAGYGGWGGVFIHSGQ